MVVARAARGEVLDVVRTAAVVRVAPLAAMPTTGVAAQNPTTSSVLEVDDVPIESAGALGSVVPLNPMPATGVVAAEPTTGKVADAGGASIDDGDGVVRCSATI